MTNADKRQALGHYEMYLRSSHTSLRDAYGSYSRAKEDAWEYCKELMNKKNGYGLKVITANSFMFTAGFLFVEDGTEKFMYITKSKDIAVEVA